MASLVMIPSGFKATKLYSVIPNDGTGDFTHARSTTATRFNSSGLIETSAIDVPRLDYLDSTCPLLLLESQRTNLLVRSEQFDNAVWAGGTDATTVADTAIAPDGNMTAERITRVSAIAERKDQTITISASTYYVFSVWVKEGTQNTGKFRIAASTTVETLGSFNATSEWVRYEILIPNTNTNTNVTFRIYPSNGVGDPGSNGDNTLIWGAQVEQGQFKASYIPTVASTVTRTVDSCNNAGDINSINSPEGVFYLQMSALFDDLSDRFITVSDGTVANRVLIGYNTTTEEITALIDVGSANQATLSYTSSDITALSKIALKWKVNDFALWVDGVERDTDVSGSSFGADVLTECSFDDGAGANDFYGKVKELEVYQTALTDVELTTLTT